MGSFVVDDLRVAEVMEILLNQKMEVYNDTDKIRYAFAKTDYIGRVYAQANNIVRKFKL